MVFDPTEPDLSTKPPYIGYQSAKRQLKQDHLGLSS